MHMQVLGLMEKSKSMVFTGHSLGGSIASLYALWLLCHHHSSSSSIPILCITFGSPLLGNESFSRAILRERWGGNFCHVVSKHDIMPRLLFAPLLTPQLHFLLNNWHLSMAFRNPAGVLQIPDGEKAEFFQSVLDHLERSSQLAVEGERREMFWPFGNYLFCSEQGGICLENTVSVRKIMYLMLATGSLDECICDHLNYGDYIGNFSSEFLKRRNFMQGGLGPCSSYEAGVSLALQSLGIAWQVLISIFHSTFCLFCILVSKTPNILSPFIFGDSLDDNDKFELTKTVVLSCCCFSIWFQSCRF